MTKPRKSDKSRFVSTVDNTMIAHRASLNDLDVIAPLFDAYRQFYGATSDLALARSFIEDRLRNDDSVIFIASAPGYGPAGFTQLYPTFSSVSAAPILILNDLFVARAARRLGVGALLLEMAAEYGRANGAVRLSLRTENNNTTAQRLYEQEGWTREDRFYSYDLTL
jgi:ribosomal protein S18 acetylase RimI-like enzyme